MKKVIKIKRASAKISIIGDSIIKTRGLLPLAASLAATLLFASSASGQQRTFVSGLGNDGKPCTRTAPCRTFTQALSLTNIGGEVVVLDSAGYGPFAISHSVSIIAPPGVYAGISVFSGNAIDISAMSGDTVVLRGLTINNQGSTGNGIAYHSGGTLHVESCVVTGFSFGGVASGVLFGAGGTLEVKNSVFSGNGDGIHIESAAGTVVGVIDGVRLEGGTGNGLAVFADSNPSVQVTIRNSVATDNAFEGMHAFCTVAAIAEINVENCVASNNATGIGTDSNTGIARIRVSNSTITGNTKGLWNVGATAVILSRGNNTVEGNGTDLVGTIGSYTAK